MVFSPEQDIQQSQVASDAQKIGRSVETAEGTQVYGQEGLLPVGQTTPTVTDKGNGFLSEVGMRDSGAGASLVTQQKGYLDQTYPATTSDPSAAQAYEQQHPGDKTYAGQEGSQYGGKATFTNANGQEMQLTQDQLNDPKTQEFLRNGGYVTSKSDFPVNSDFSTQKEQALDSATKDVENLTKDFLSYNVDADPAFKREAENIKGEFSKLKQEMEKTNYQRQRAFETLGFRTGSSQYAGVTQMGIEGEELKQGSERIAEIGRQEAQAIAQARVAFETGKFNKFNQQVNALKDLREMKAKELENYNKKIADFSASLREEQKDLLEKQKFAFEVKKFETEQKVKGAAAKELKTISAGSSLYDPQTGEIIGTAPEPLDTKAPEIKEWGGLVHQWNPVKQSWDVVGSKEGDQAGGNHISAANLIASGKAKLTDYPSEDRGAISDLLVKMPPKKEDVTAVQEKIGLINSLLKDKGMDTGVGAFAGNRINFNPLSWSDKAQRNAFVAKIDKMVGEKALQALIDAKANGATFGALSEGELNLLKSSASTISSWARDKNGDGKTDYYEVGQKEFKEELGRIKEGYAKLLQDTAGENVATDPVQQSLTDFYKTASPEDRQLMESMRSSKNPTTGQPYSYEDISQIMGIPLSKAGSDASSAKLGSLSQRFESGGDPGAIGRDTTGGWSYGTYQLAHNNAQKFVNQSEYAQEFAGIPFNSQEFRTKWQEIAKQDPAGFTRAQADFIEQTHFQPQVDKLARADIDLEQYSPVLKEIVMSTAVQHGANTDVIEKAVKRLGKDATEADIIKEIYKERWSGGKRFANSTPGVRKAVYNRFFGKNGELNQALSMLG